MYVCEDLEMNNIAIETARDLKHEILKEQDRIFNEEMKLKMERDRLLEELPENGDEELEGLATKIERINKLLDPGDLAFPSAHEQFKTLLELQGKLKRRQDQLLEMHHPGYPKTYDEKILALEEYSLRVGLVERERNR